METPFFAELLEKHLSRRQFLQSAGVLGISAAFPLSACALTSSETLVRTQGFAFTEIAKARTSNFDVPEGYIAEPLVKWGDPLLSGAPAFDSANQTAAGQASQFGYNCDYTAYFPLSQGEFDERGLLCVNHEYAIPHLMFENVPPKNLAALSAEQRAICMQAVGVSVVEVARKGNAWRYIPESRYNRRITASTPIRISGVAAGHPRLRTSYDPTGTLVYGTLSNCAGGVTPWQTYLTAEENFDMSFAGPLRDDHPEYRNLKQYGVGEDDRSGWAASEKRFDIQHEPNESNRFGYIVEIDIHDPSSTPVKHTALGRFKHECATCAFNDDGRIAVYSGDDEMFQYLFRFVSSKPYGGGSGIGASVLNEGTLYTARFEENGTLRWLPLIQGQGELVPEQGFDSQADVMIECRRAAQLLGATPMDRPEDIEVDARTGHIYVALSNNVTRFATDAANPRGPNFFGHIIVLKPPVKKQGINHAAEIFEWDIVMQCGDPRNWMHGAKYAPGVSEHGWLVSPDNLALDTYGNLWIASDGQPRSINYCDSLYACEIKNGRAGPPRLFLNVPSGAEATGPCFSPDGTTLFISVQHPGEDLPMAKAGAYWPDFRKGMPPRPAVMTVRHQSGGKVGYG